jgi:beta-glucosidase
VPILTPPTRRRTRPPGALAALAATALAVSVLPAATAAAAPAADLVAVRAERPAVQAGEGSAARVRLTLTTRSGAPLTAPVTLRYATGAGSRPPAPTTPPPPAR